MVWIFIVRVSDLQSDFMSSFHFFVAAIMTGRYLARPRGSNLPRRSWWGSVYGNGDPHCGNSGFPDDCTSDEPEEDHRHDIDLIIFLFLSNRPIALYDALTAGSSNDPLPGSQLD